MELVDAHAHIDPKTLGEADTAAVVERATQAGVAQIIAVGATEGLAHNQVALDLASAFPGRVFATVGVHPHDAARVPDDAAEQVRRLAADPRCVAVGEIGLDFHYDHAPRAQARELFARLLGVALDVGKPVVVHTRSADAETLELLASEGGSGLRGVIHCFSHDYAFGRAALDMGLMLSIPGIVTFPGARLLREALGRLPLDRMMVETDCPFLAPVPHRGRRNEPAYVVETARRLAQVKGVDLEQVAALTTANARELFRISGAGSAGGEHRHTPGRVEDEVGGA